MAGVLFTCTLSDQNINQLNNELFLETTDSLGLTHPKNGINFLIYLFKFAILSGF